MYCYCHFKYYNYNITFHYRLNISRAAIHLGIKSRSEAKPQTRLRVRKIVVVSSDFFVITNCCILKFKRDGSGKRLYAGIYKRKSLPSIKHVTFHDGRVFNYLI